MSASDIPVTSPGGLVQSGGYMNTAGADRSPAVGISGMAPVSSSGGGGGGGLSSLLSSGGEEGAGGGFMEAAMAALAAL